MFIVEFAPKAARQIAKLEESSKHSIKIYLKEKVMTAKNKKDLYDAGGTELAGNFIGTNKALTRLMAYCATCC